MFVSSANEIGFDGSAIIFGGSYIYRLRRTKEKVLNLEEHRVFF